MLIVWLICTLSLVTNSITTPINSTQAPITATSFPVQLDQSDENTDLDKAESNDKKKLEIIKQIRRVNSDGTYTVGYEAVDGRFKIESRDVLGNVKGTYGYINSNGEIERVSYTANNATNDARSTPQTLEEVTQAPRLNKTIFVSQSTRRPSSLSFLMTSTSSPAHMNANIMQAIPKRRILLTSPSVANHGSPQYSFRKADSLNIAPSKSASKPIEPIPAVVYATSIRSTIQPAVENQADDQLPKFNSFESSTKNTGLKIDQNEKGNLQNERKPARGNSLRRQLSGDQSENFESNQQIIYNQASDEESTHTYTGITGTQRPVFTTTNSPRIPALVLAARSRAAHLKNAALLSTQTPSSTSERTYTKQPRRNSEPRENNESNNEQIADREYLTQSPEIVQIPSSRDNEQTSEIKSHSHRHPNSYLPRITDFSRQSHTNHENNEGPIQYKFSTQTQPAYIHQNQDDKQFLRETTGSNLNIATTISSEPFINQDLNAATQSLLQSFHPNGQQAYDSRHPDQNQNDPQSQRSSIPLPLQPYNIGYGPLNAPQYNYPERPVTARDFERLLSLLILRYQQQQQRFSLLPSLMNGFHHGGLNGLGHFSDFNAYNPFNYPVLRSPLYNQFDPRYTAFSRSLPPLPPPNSFYGTFSEQENMYQAQNPVEQHLPYMSHSIQPRKKLNNDNNSMVGTSVEHGESRQNELKTESFLPPEVREELLYRMLMLAIQPDIGGQLSIPDASTMQEYFRAHKTVPAKSIPTTSVSNSEKPVRSVQILGEE